MLIDALDLDPDRPRRQKVAHPAGPFDHDYPPLFQQFFESNPLKIFRAAYAIGIQMKQSQPAALVDVQQNVCRTADGTRVAAEAAQQAADELGLAGAKFAFEGNAFSAAETLCQCDSKSLGLIRTV